MERKEKPGLHTAREAVTPACPPASGSGKPLPPRAGPLSKAPVPSVGVQGGRLGRVFSSALSPSQAHWPLSLTSLAKHLSTEAHLLSSQLETALREHTKPTTSPLPSFTDRWLRSICKSAAAGSSPLPTLQSVSCLELLTFSNKGFLCFWQGWEEADFASPTGRLARHHLLLMGLCRVSLVPTQFFEAKKKKTLNAFILTAKWSQQLQQGEEIRYKLGPYVT